MTYGSACAVAEWVIQEPEPVWTPATDPALKELLDHLAEELAREYVRLMEKAAEEERTRGGEARGRTE